MSINKTNCTQQTNGYIKDIKILGQDFPTMVSVEYQVNGACYEITESLKYKSEKIKLGFLTVGQKRVPAMGNTSVGSMALVNYNPNNPAEAFLSNNLGKANV